MADPIDAIVAAAGAAKATDPVATEAAKAGTALWTKVLGPPAEAIGDHLRARIELWSEDFLAARVLKRAAKKVEEDVPGSVPPRVAADVFEKAQWAEDELLAEYLSGVLASSRTWDGKDDSGVGWTALVGRLSTDQLRMHYVIYSALCRKGRTVQNPGSLDSWLMVDFFVKGDGLFAALGWDASGWIERVLNALYVLERERLIDGLSYGPARFWSEDFEDRAKVLPIEVEYMVKLTGTASGVQLLMQAWGRGNRVIDAVTNEFIPLDVGDDSHALDSLVGFWIEDFEDKPSDA